MSRRAAPGLDSNEPPTKRSRISDTSPSGELPLRDPLQNGAVEIEENEEQLDEGPVVGDSRASDLYLDTVSIVL
jgi:hypothetical protein